MTRPSSAPTQRPNIRFSRTTSLVTAIAIGSSITMGLGIFILLDLMLQLAGPRTPQVYMVAVVLFVPIILTYAERAAVLSISGGIFDLVRAGGSIWRPYASGWLLLGGHLALIALLGWGAAFYLNIGLEWLFGIGIELRWLAPAIVIIVALNELIGTPGHWRLRSLVIYGAMLFLLVLVMHSWWLEPAPELEMISTGLTSSSFISVIGLMAASLWGIAFVLDRRDELRQPEQTILPALLLPLVVSGILGALMVTERLRLLGGSLLDIAGLTGQLAGMFAGNTLSEVLFVTLGFLLAIIALDFTMVGMVRLAGTMVHDGFLPERFLRISPRMGTPLFALRIFAVLSAVATAFVPKLTLVGIVALTFLGTTILLGAPEILQSGPRLPAERRLKLPFHPLFPSLACIISVLLALTLPVEVLLIGTAWAVVGGIYYVAYAHRGGMQVRRQGEVVGNPIIEQRKVTHTVLVGLANPETAPALLRAGVALARAKKGRVLALKVAIFPDQVPQHLQRQLAEQEFDELQQTIDCCIPTDGVPVEVLVRMAHTPADGILATSQEERADLILLGWEGDRTPGAFELMPLLDPIVRNAACEVVVLRGQLPQKVKRILVPTAGSPNSIAAMKLAQGLVEPDTGEVVAFHLVQEVFSPNTMDERQYKLQAILDNIQGTPIITPYVLATDDVQEGILREAQGYDMLLLGASRGGALDQTIFGGPPVEVARAAPLPTLLVKHYEKARSFWLRRAWETISAPFPKLTLSEREDIYQHMWRASHPSVDFFIMIGLSAMIAALGLLLSSPAIIIGAMLVAPLMLPILAVGMSMVQGDLRLLRTAAVATILGIVLAISISASITLITPAQINTSEILSRTRPTLLDLLVALASGAAGGYAAARKEVAAALPGVAIAAALVPPLGVIGYGTATGQFEIAGGSLLLFTTNLIAIVVAAAVVFLLLGFRPGQARMRQVVQLKFLLSVLALLLISIPLAFFSVNGMGQTMRQNQIETLLIDSVNPELARVDEILVEHRNEGFVVYVTIHTLNADELTADWFTELEIYLAEMAGAPVSLQATVLQAVQLPARSSDPLPASTPAP